FDRGRAQLLRPRGQLQLRRLAAPGRRGWRGCGHRRRHRLRRGTGLRRHQQRGRRRRRRRRHGLRRERRQGRLRERGLERGCASGRGWRRGVGRRIWRRRRDEWPRRGQRNGGRRGRTRRQRRRRRQSGRRWPSRDGGQSGAGGMGGLGPEAPGGRISGYGTVLFWANANNQIVRLQTTMVVPPEPPATGTLFLWPGLQPDGANYDPIDNGVLQPVLTWGSSCAPGKQPRAYSTWWISGQYVNTNGSDPGYTGCAGGPIMSVAVGDTLDLDFSLAGTIWTQTVTDAQTGQSVSYSIDMMNQAQNL